MLLNLLANLSYYIPEALAIVSMCLLLIIEATYKLEDEKRTFVYVSAFIGLLSVLAALICNLGVAPVKIFSNALVIDQFSTLIKIIMTLSAIGVLYLSSFSKDIYKSQKSEFIVMSIGVLIGGMLLASANNLLTVYLGIEILSILSYVMASFKREDVKSSEAGLKYILYGGVTAGIMLFGMSHIYGALGSIQFDTIGTAIKGIQGLELWIVMVSFVLYFVGLGYKVSCVPFHMWSPDVYEGSPIPVTTFFSLVPKFAGLAAIMRTSMVFFGDPSLLSQVWIGLLHVVAALTMTVGNVTAIGQSSVKRLLAFSSIGHVGMMLLGILVMDQTGAQAILFYAITYMFMTLVAFYITSHISDNYGSDHRAYFKGLINKHPAMAIALIIVLFSLAGIPPMSGFVAKYNILSVVIAKKMYGIAIIAIINSAIALYYYMGLVRTLVFEKAEEVDPIKYFNFKNQLVIALICIPVVTLGIFWEKVMMLAQGAAIFIK